MAKKTISDLHIAVVGATGAVGTEFLNILKDHYTGLPQLTLLASARSAGNTIEVNGEAVVIQEATPESFEGVDIAFISVSSEISLDLAPHAVKAGAIVIDDSSAFRMDDTVPLVVPEVNGDDCKWHEGIISIPNCSTTPLVMVLQALRELSEITRVTASTYQSVSGAGSAAMTALTSESTDLMNDKDVNTDKDQIGFNVIPRIDEFLDNGYTKEEQKMIDESKKILHLPNLSVSATCARVPVYISHSEAVHIEFKNSVNLEDVRNQLNNFPGITVMDDPKKDIYPMPYDIEGKDDVYVGRIRKDTSVDNGIVLWIVSDNLRKGAALNSLQIAETLVKLDLV
jgi:aspartate-semialdehyde dehydrogenase